MSISLHIKSPHGEFSIKCTHEIEVLIEKYGDLMTRSNALPIGDDGYAYKVKRKSLIATLSDIRNNVMLDTQIPITYQFSIIKNGSPYKKYSTGGWGGLKINGVPHSIDCSIDLCELHKYLLDSGGTTKSIEVYDVRNEKSILCDEGVVIKFRKTSSKKKSLSWIDRFIAGLNGHSDDIFIYIG